MHHFIELTEVLSGHKILIRAGSITALRRAYSGQDTDDPLTAFTVVTSGKDCHVQETPEEILAMLEAKA